MVKSNCQAMYKSYVSSSKINHWTKKSVAKCCLPELLFLPNNQNFASALIMNWARYNAFGCWITWFISRWEENDCCQSLANSNNGNYFCSKWQLLTILNEINCHFENLLRFNNSYFHFSLRSITWSIRQQPKAWTNIGHLFLLLNEKYFVSVFVLSLFSSAL